MRVLEVVQRGLHAGLGEVLAGGVLLRVAADLRLQRAGGEHGEPDDRRQCDGRQDQQQRDAASALRAAGDVRIVSHVLVTSARPHANLRNAYALSLSLSISIPLSLSLTFSALPHPCGARVTPAASPARVRRTSRTPPAGCPGPRAGRR